jgi:hypothetical protein
MIHLSGTFAYQRGGNIVVVGPGGRRLPESLPAAFYINVMLRNDDGTAVFPDEPANVGAWVVLSQPQALATVYELNLSLDYINAGYLGFTGQVDPSDAATLPADWTPLALLIWAKNVPVGIITSAPEPVPDIGIAPPTTTIGGGLV